ncbi:MAG: glycosyltransferase, partial [Candidatus Dormibacteraeota bacterium]|nr:glycosyltransferase [Candidatus Dormibacteraeota bacterium]
MADPRRVLFTTTGGLGHLHPLIPLAGELRRRGNEVAFAGPLSFLGPVLDPIGFEAFGVGRDGADAEVESIMAEAIRRGGQEGERYFLANLYARVNTRRMVPDLRALCRRWSPDVLVHEAAEFGAWLVGEQLGLPHCCVQVGAFLIDDLRV